MPARLLLALLSGVSMYLAFPSHGVWPLAVVGAGGVALAATGARVRGGFLVGLVAGLGYFVPLLSWSGIYVGALPWLALATLEALYIALLGAVVGALSRRGSPREVPVPVLGASLAWVASELARSTTPFGGFPWGRLAFSQADSPVLGVASLLGTPGVTFLVALAGALLARAVQELAAGRHSVRRAGAATGVLAMVGAVVVVLAPTTVPRPVDGTPVQVLGVQGNVPEMTLEFNAQRREVLDRHARTTLAAADLVAAGELSQPALVVWPENSSDIDPLRNADAEQVINQAVEGIGAPVVVGAVLREPEGYVSNASLLWLPGEGVVDRYVKQRPVPFAEYIPYRDFFRLFSDKVDLVSRDFYPGDEVGRLDVPLASGSLPVGVAICFEVVVDDLMRENVREGAELLLVPTNNATFGFTDESVQQLAASRVKAVELGRSVVHISTVGVSGLVTPDGRVHDQTELFTQDIIAGELPRRTELTLAVRLGGWPEGVAVGALALLLVIRVAGTMRVRVSSGR
ncbi:apolipoprotein N-acyltransferase [Ornithinicoccus hortensis]|uniref:Apolipoprotein N-acyltransferase n=1 Tax=Ornithinicoccus hortensis TaxID=82346 RepID=A0A542YT35_9MICO|nr:apolipoprotein N-acyltransferase [Ornithinicoccus hortensis]TQL51217.1 apolipoprotein N-acyltransferase [Ornithinicoccus hortensis]